MTLRKGNKKEKRLSQMKNNDKELYISSMLTEYKSLRDQINLMVDRQYSQIYWAISSIAIIIAAIVSSWRFLLVYPFIPLSIFFFLLPGLVLVYYLSWLHIVMQLTEIGSYIYLVEEKMGKLLRSGYIFKIPSDQLKGFFHLPIGWEHSLWDTKKHKFFSPTFTILRWAIIIFTLLSITLGTLMVNTIFNEKIECISPLCVWIAMGLIYIFWIMIYIFLFRFISRRLEEAQKNKEKKEQDCIQAMTE